ncbi:CRISPR-associated helicase Cas3' [Spirulina sp.]|uniref:CRISPR-associated helicase Cas3' n=1 Tax=Spirulina sp. TaxID=1157 RepID=UPI003F6FB996
MSASKRPPDPCAHTPSSDRPEQWHDLKAHLKAVAKGTQKYAQALNAPQLGSLAGLWHDLGKYNPAFQDYLVACHRAEQSGGRKPHTCEPHAIYGAKLAYDYAEEQAEAGHLSDTEILEPLALIINGHHAGLAALSTLEDKLHKVRGKNSRETEYIYTKVVELATAEAIEVQPHVEVSEFAHLEQLNHLQQELFWRLLFSCLIDSDRLDTEAFYDPKSAALRQSKITLQHLQAALEPAHQKLLAQIQASHRQTPVYAIRQTVLDACRHAADRAPGVFRLCVPTGGGKTRSGLTFALNHALKNHQDRVIFAVPYTSIIEQTAQVYREIFESLDPNAIIEHHSAVWQEYFTSEKESNHPRDEDARAAYAQARLMTQNWDAPLIVTTTVQLFDSLFAAHPSQCRKLHNIVNSVIVLDEVQTLPIDLLAPILDVLNELVRTYGVTVVLCTATQPAFEGQTHYLQGFPDVQDIIPPADVQQHFTQLQRVNYELPSESWSWDQLAADVLTRDTNQVLFILNTRRDALAVVAALESAGMHANDILHLSTLLCGAHRRRVLADVKGRLQHGQPCYLVSTQVVEAGVDLDFPVVYRALGPLDRIVQAAGRCNREGHADRGAVIIFEPTDGGNPAGEYKIACQETRSLLHTEGVENLHQPQIFDTYFKRLYQAIDQHQGRGANIQKYRAALNYPKVAEEFSLIAQETIAVVVDYDDSFGTLAKIQRRGWLQRGDRAQLQPYVVNLYHREFKKLSSEWEEIVPGLWQWTGEYDPRLGIALYGEPLQYDPFDLMPELPPSLK